MSNFIHEEFIDGQMIFKWGDPATDLYFLKKGKVELLDQKGQVFGAISEGQSFGEAAILSGGIRNATVCAKGDVVCKKINNLEAVNLLCSFSPLFVVVMEALLLQQSMNNAIKRD